MPAIEYVGLRVDGQTVSLTEERKSVIAAIQQPETVTQLRSFLGLINYVRDFIPNFADHAAPLYELLKGKTKKSERVDWNNNASSEFTKLKELAAASQALWHLQTEDDSGAAHPITVMTDASDLAVGGVILQNIDGVDKPICFLSKKLSPAQRNYHTSDKEMYGVFYTIRTAHTLLAGRRFTVLTDHRALLSSKLSASPRIERMKLLLQEYDFSIKYIEGDKNSSADLLSRWVALQIQPTEVGSDADLDVPDDGQLGLEEEEEAQETESEETKRRTIALFHNSIKGHNGRDPTVGALRQAGFNWANIARDVQNFINNCEACSQVKSPRPEFRRTRFTLAAGGPGEEWSGDILQFESRDVRNYKYVLVVIDAFSRFCHLRAMRSQDSGDCIVAFESIFYQWGAPGKFRCDHGSQLRSNVTAAVLATWGTEFTEDSPSYSSQAHGQVERVIRSVREMMGTIVQEEGRNRPWSEFIPRIQFQLNTRIHSATGLAPADLLLGKANALGWGPMSQEISAAKAAAPEELLHSTPVLAVTRRSTSDLQPYAPPADITAKEARAQLRYLNRASGNGAAKRDLAKEAWKMEGLRSWLQQHGEPLWHSDSEPDSDSEAGLDSPGEGQLASGGADQSNDARGNTLLSDSKMEGRQDNLPSNNSSLIDVHNGPMHKKRKVGDIQEGQTPQGRIAGRSDDSDDSIESGTQAALHRHHAGLLERQEQARKMSLRKARAIATDPTPTPPQLHQGQQVWVRAPLKENDIGYNHWLGPMVISVVHGNTVVVFDLHTDRTHHVDIQRLRLCRGRRI